MEFIEATAFTKYVYDYIDEDEFSALQWFLVLHPQSGDLIPGGGGLRKLRWQAKGKGKRGGVRVIYYFVGKRDEIWLLSIYAKNELTDIPKDVLAQLRKEIENA
jgi:mRNA-degrading endonuclease RelE of RelBE toxin-antitoxin system